MSKHDKDYFRETLTKLADHPILTREQEQKLFRAMKAGDPRAKPELMRCNGKLVISVALKYAETSAMSKEDFVQEGMLGLSHAIDKFDYQMGHKLSTYAMAWIRQHIVRAIDCAGENIRLPVHMSERVKAVSKVRLDLEAKLGRTASPDEIATAMARTVKWVEDSKRPDVDSLNWQNEIGDGMGDEVGGQIPDPRSPDPYAVVVADDLEEFLRVGMIKFLTPRERRIMTLRHGLEGQKQHTLEEIGDMLNITRERVRQIHEKSIYRLRLTMRSDEFTLTKGE